MQRQDPVTIPLGGGPDEATAKLLRGPGVLAVALDGDTTKAGGLTKARGFVRITTTSTTHGETPESVFISVGTDRGELVVVGERSTYGLAASDALVDGAALVLRGPSVVGNFREGVVHVASLGSES